MPFSPWEDADEQTIMGNLVASRQANEAARYRAALQQMKMQMLLQRMAQQRQAQEQRALWDEVRLNRWMNPEVGRPQRPQGFRRIGPEGRAALRQRLLEYGARPVEVDDIINQFLQRDDAGIPPEVRGAFAQRKTRPLKMDTRAKEELIAGLLAKDKKGKGLGYEYPEAQQLIEQYVASGGDPAVFSEQERIVPAIARNLEFMKRYRPQPPRPRPQEAYVHDQQGGAPRREVYAGGTMGPQEAPRDDRAAIRRWYTQGGDWQQAYDRFQDPNVFMRGAPDLGLVAKMQEQQQENLRRRASQGDIKALGEILTTVPPWLREGFGRWKEGLKYAWRPENAAFRWEDLQEPDIDEYAPDYSKLANLLPERTGFAVMKDPYLYGSNALIPKQQQSPYSRENWWRRLTANIFE